MGWSCSWVAVKGAAADEVLATLDLVETGQEALPGSRSAPMCYAVRPDGWLVLFSEDFDWAERGKVLELSRFGMAVGCQFEDRVEMTSVATCAEAGVELWRVFHTNDPLYRLDVSGEPPAAYAGIRDAHIREQDEDGGEDSNADFIHDVPLELAKSACGYRADEDEAVFKGLRFASGRAPRPSTGLLGSLLAVFRRR
jgi:hypothetical protein